MVLIIKYWVLIHLKVGTLALEGIELGGGGVEPGSVKELETGV